MVVHRISLFVAAVIVRLVRGAGPALFAASLGIAPAQHAWAETVTVGDQRFEVELARTPRERMRGLMFRERLPRGHGMLFIQPEPGPVAFWMKNTLIPLDILYFDEDGRLAQILSGVPPCITPDCPTYPSRSEVGYVLELNAGAAARRGLRIGDALTLED